MILTDSSIWVDHLRHGDARLARDLEASRVFTHPFIIGEIALGSLRQRATVLDLLRGLPEAAVANDAEVQRLIKRQPLYSLGIGYVDAHLIAATLLTPGLRLRTRDRRLHEVASQMGLAEEP